MSILKRITNKANRIYLVLLKKNFRFYRLSTELKSTFQRNTPNICRLTLLCKDNNRYSFKFNNNDFVFNYLDPLCVPALEWCYYEIIVNPNSGHYYEKYGSIVKEGDVVLDCGACEGYFTYKIKDLAKTIYCFEPNSKMAECLTRTFYKQQNVKIINMGVGKESGYSRFSFGSNQAGYRKGSNNPKEVSELVKIVSIDEFANENHLKKIDYIKADVEGSEIDLINGAQMVIKKYKPRISITTYHFASHANQIVEAVLKFEPRYKYRLGGIAMTGRYKEEKKYNTPRPMMAYFWV